VAGRTTSLQAKKNDRLGTSEGAWIKAERYHPFWQKAGTLRKLPPYIIPGSDEREENRLPNG
jgi:hypothetical protein